jgi:hypothetical protein
MRPLPNVADRLARALRLGGAALDELAGAEPASWHDALLTLLTIHDLHLAPVDQLGATARWQHHPAVATLKVALEDRLLVHLDVAVAERGDDRARRANPVAAMRAIAKIDLVPPVYDWLAREADWDELVEFLAFEGGPDAGFDDLVASCQIGLDGEAKLELARNYWDEMGRGDLAAVHTELHRRLVAALDMPRIPRSDLPVQALERSALGGLLATNRWLQPEMLGALGLIELQAGPRCRRVVAALERLGAPVDAFRFYVEHADVDPLHGKDWLDHALTGQVEHHPEWGERIVRGAEWRSAVNARFFEAVAERFLKTATLERAS